MIKQIQKYQNKLAEPCIYLQNNFNAKSEFVLLHLTTRFYDEKESKFKLSSCLNLTGA